MKRILIAALALAPIAAAEPVPCSMLGARQSRFCVKVDVKDGFIAPTATGELHLLADFKPGKYSKPEIERLLTTYAANLLKKVRLADLADTREAHAKM